MPHLNPGYDVISTEPDFSTRYIEVKGIGGPWGEAGVAVTRRQFDFATEKLAEVWLYVVEHVRDGNAKVYPIQDPAGKVTHFFYDVGWRAVSDAATHPSAAERVDDPPMAGDRVVLLDGELVEVSAVEGHGLISRLTVRSANGEPKHVIWRPGMIVEGRGTP
jgi:hypothetical protein